MNKFDRNLAIVCVALGVTMGAIGIFVSSSWIILIGATALTYAVYLMIIEQILRKKYGQK